jgi:hypothetical protein
MSGHQASSLLVLVETLALGCMSDRLTPLIIDQDSYDFIYMSMQLTHICYHACMYMYLHNILHPS